MLRCHSTSPPPGQQPPFLKILFEPTYTPPTSDHACVYEWLESLPPNREKRSLSEGHRYQPRLIKAPLKTSASEMKLSHSVNMNSATSAVSKMPPPSFVNVPSSGQSQTNATAVVAMPRGRRLVDQPTYRRVNLKSNNIFMCSSRETLPSQQRDLVTLMDHGRDDSPGELAYQKWQTDGVEELALMGYGQSAVDEFFRDKIFPKCTAFDELIRCYKIPMIKNTIPTTGSEATVSIPAPDMIYGYRCEAAFPEHQSQLQILKNEPAANNISVGLLYPFLTVEFTGEEGNMWSATNQCIGAAASCINIAERLNSRLKNCKSAPKQVNSTVFSMAVNGSEARIFVSWKNDIDEYWTKTVKGFTFLNPDHYVDFHKCVLNIIDWGKGPRLEEIQAGLDALVEERRQCNAKKAKSRAAPSDGTGNTAAKKRKVD